jgi:periplasmic protein TonB
MATSFFMLLTKCRIVFGFICSHDVRPYVARSLGHQDTKGLASWFSAFHREVTVPHSLGRQCPLNLMPSLAPTSRRTLYIVVSVLVLHVLALWGLQSGLLQRATTMVQEMVVPASVITELPVVTPSVPKPALPAKATPTPTPVVATARPTAGPAPAPAVPALVPAPQATPDTTPSTNAATEVQHGPASGFAMAAPAAAPAPAPLPRPEQPSTEAEYLVSPSREYPLRCMRRREQGRVVVRVLIGVDGNAENAEIASSSGSECLNREALATAMAAKYKPVIRGGVAVQAWRNASYKFVLPE